MCCVKQVTIHDGSGIHGPVSKLKAPDFFACVDLKCMQISIASTADQNSLSVDRRNHGNATIGIGWTDASGTPPNHLTGGLVERDKPDTSTTMGTPVGTDHADDHKVTFDDRTGNATTIASDAPELFSHRLLPFDLAGFTIKTKQQSLRSMGVDISGLWVANRHGPTKPNTHNRRKEDAKAMLPDHIASSCIHANDAFLFVGVFTDSANGINLVVHHDGSRTATYILFHPQHVVDV